MRAFTGPAVQVAAAVTATALVSVALPTRGEASSAAVAESLLRASGFTALLWAYLGLVVGLAASTRVAACPPILGRGTALSLHRQLNLVALALTLVHVASYLVAPGGSLLVALVPQTAPVGAVGYTMGVLALYLALLLGPTWYLRARIGRWVWLVAHQFAALSYAAGLWHTVLLGGDVRVDGWVRTTVWLAQVPLLVLLGLRLSWPRRPADHHDAGLRHPRFASARQVRFRVAVHTGALAAGGIVLVVALTAAAGGLHATR